MNDAERFLLDFKELIEDRQGKLIEGELEDGEGRTSGNYIAHLTFPDGSSADAWEMVEEAKKASGLA